ncbi:MAG: hypothetical protein ACI8VL_001966 [Bacteroidia bacterium]|jgi:hypothetical protein
MKQLIGLLMIAAIATGCATKDEKARTNLTQVWRVSKVLENGADVTSSYTNSRVTYRLSFDGNGSFLESYFPFSGAPQVSVSGTWFFSDGINKISLDDSNQSRIYQVDLLDEEHLNITDLGSSNERQIEFVPQ